MKIKITENGPYLVSGGVPIREMIITRKGRHYELKEGRKLPQAEEYALCRCGGSKNAPFCDGTHECNGFDGTETASRAPYAKRLEDFVEGENIDLLDDGRCAFARFCHRDEGTVWELTEDDAEGDHREEAIIAANQCPSGRLLMIDKEGHPIEEKRDPEIIVLQDPENHVSGGLFVVGRIPLEAVDGTTYELRNRYDLCRCGQSDNKPFCDASHVNYRFRDKAEHKEESRSK